MVRARSLPPPAAWMLALTAAFVWPRGAAAEQGELQEIKNEVSAMGVKLKTLIADYEKPEVVGPVRKFSDRLTNGEILFLLGDYQRASLVLYDLVMERQASRETLYPKALFYLAESLYQIGHDLSARQFFQELVERRDRQHLSNAIRRLIQIADRNEAWAGLEEHVAVLERRGQLPPGIAYIRGKSLLRQGHPGKAAQVFQSIPREHDLGLKAAYLLAVAQLQAGDLEKALNGFKNLVHSKSTTQDADRIRDLAAMNHGRILLEQGRYGESIDAYQFVDRQSPYFEEALFEITWTFVRAADEAKSEAERLQEFNKAQNALEILLLAEAENPIAPEARLLLGNIHMRLGKFEEATTMFDDVISRYGAPRDQLNELVAKEIRPEAYFEAMASEREDKRGLLSPLAVHWAREEDQLKDALALVAGLDESEASLEEADEITEKLIAILESNERMSFFPTMQEAQGHILEYHNALLALSQRLLVVERQAVEKELSNAARAELKAVLAERAALEPAYRSLPKQKEEYEGRLGKMRGQILEMQQQAYRIRYDIDSMRAQLNGLRVWINQNRQHIDEGTRLDYSARIEQHDREVAELEDLHRQLEETIRSEKALMSITSEEQVHEEEIRARYAATLEKEREILATADRLSGEAAIARKDIDRQREVIATYRSELERFERRLEEVVERKAGDLRAEVLKERGVLERHRQAIAEERQAAKRVIGQVARGSLSHVQQKFHDIVLRANVGIVDVAWALKEAQTHEISRRVTEQRRELQVLDEEFSEVLQNE